MRPLTLEDLLPLDDFASRRREFFESLGRYLDRYRRVRLGPRITLVFENRQTLWFRVQDLLRVARVQEPEYVQRELAIYNRLLPRRHQLQAALIVEIGEETRLSQQLAPWSSLDGKDLVLELGDSTYPAKIVTARPEDRCIGAALWVSFTLDAAARRMLADLERSARFVLTLAGQRHESALLGDEIRQSLLEDLELSDSDQDAA